MCSRIELKMTETETKQLHQNVSTFCYAVGFAAVFLSDANRIHHNRNPEMQWWCHTSKTTQPAGAFSFGIPQHGASPGRLEMQLRTLVGRIGPPREGGDLLPALGILPDRD